MGEVYLAEDARLGRKVAIKLLPSETSRDDKARQRLLREARAASAHNHPNVVTIYSIEEADGRDFIVMEYIEGETLRVRIDRGPLELSEVLDLGAQLADGLAASHSAGLVHRDVKSSNILITPRGQAKLLDFGLAKQFRPPSGSLESGEATLTHLTAAGEVVGTFAYMSPEQTRGEPLDARTDIFSLGCVLYEAATGKLPFKGPSALSIMHEIATADPALPSAINRRLTPRLDLIIKRALAKNRENRYSSALELGAALRELKESVSERFGFMSVSGGRPETKYAKSGDVNIAYQVVGSGPFDLVYVMGWVTNLDYFWEEPSYARFLGRLASFSRLILFDKRGTGLSDRVHESELPTLEQRMDDVRAVMDAVGSNRAALFGVSEGGPMSALFAATYPERTSALIMYGSYAKRIWAPDYPWAPTPEERQKFFDAIQQGWGGVVDVAIMAPSMAREDRFRQWWSAYLRRSASPGAALAFAKMNTQIDITQILPAIRVPSLIIHREGDLDADVGGARYMAEHIKGAKYVELPGDDHLPWVGDQESILDEIERFVIGIQHVPELDRVLATVLCMQITGPMPQTARPGSDRWGELLRRHRALVRTELERFRGAEIEATEGTLLATFDGPARAIRAACAIGDSARQLGIRVKAGLHTGECDLAGDKLAGVAIEIGAHVAARARAGEVLVSSTVKDLVAGSGIQFKDRGFHAIEGVPGKWRLFAVERERDSRSTNEIAVRSRGKTGNRIKAIASLAVLPLANAGDDPNMEYLSDGITETIISSLSQLPRLRVMARSTVFRYKGQDVDPRQVGRDLDVRAVLSGRVLQFGDNLVIGTELVNVADGTQLWGEQYKRKVSDIFAVQEEIAREISEKLRLRLSGEQKKQLTKRHTENAEAYQAYLKGRYYWNKRSEEAVKKGVEYFKQAIERDPGYSLAYDGLADSFNILGFYSMLPPKEAFPKAKSAALRAMEIDGKLAEAHASLAYARFYYDWDWLAAEKGFQRSIELNPNYASAHQFYGNLLTALERFEEAIAEWRRGQELDPLSLIMNAGLGWVYYFARQYDGAIEHCRKAIELDSNFELAHLWLGWAYEQKSMFDEAIAEFEEAAKLSGGRTGIIAALGHAYALSDRKEEARKVIDDLNRLSEQRYVSPYRIATIQAGLGEKEQAFESLEEAYEDRSHLLVFLKVDPKLDSIRSDPRFGELVRRMRL